MSVSTNVLRRLQQTTNHLSSTLPNDQTGLSIVHGPLHPPLLDVTLGELLNEQSSIRGDQNCLIVSWTGARWSYSELQNKSKTLAKCLLSLGLDRGDRIGILASNCEEYVTVFFASGYIGCTLVVLNSTYTAAEAHNALNHSGCKLLFIEEKYGKHTNTGLLRQLQENSLATPELKTVVLLRGSHFDFLNYSEVTTHYSGDVSDNTLEEISQKVYTHDICNFQYTSGSTGDPKAAMLTHHNLINNARAIGHRLSLSPADVLCCPPPLFHCFGLILGLLATLVAGGTIVIPSANFSASAVLAALSDNDCTALHGVPAMFEELLSLPRPVHWKCENLRTGIIAGASVPRHLMERLVKELGMREFTSSYGLTEASPTCFNAENLEEIEKELTTVGKVMPHLHAKVVDRHGRIVKIGEKGELCISGYSIMKGYWNNERKTNEAIRTDESGVKWLFTGDEACFDRDGYCTITGRYKDIIIRGGENIYPVEIESRLVLHPSGHIHRAAVIGIKDFKYGEVVGAFLLPAACAFDNERPTDGELRTWVREALGWHKAPVYIFWCDHKDVGLDEIPQTGSGKIKKHVLRDVAKILVNRNISSRRLEVDMLMDTV